VRVDPRAVFRTGFDPLYIIKGAPGRGRRRCGIRLPSGDCHYISGNLVARRKFAMLKSFLEYLGIEPERGAVFLGFGIGRRQVCLAYRKSGRRRFGSLGRHGKIVKEENDHSKRSLAQR